MLTISPAALKMIQERNKPVFLDMPKLISGCCFDVQECPTVRFGVPRNPAEYVEKVINDVTVFVPRRLPNTFPMTITVSSFLSFKRLVLEGWCMV
jgi:hypothetical protein